jgi:hypothetical protein
MHDDEASAYPVGLPTSRYTHYDICKTILKNPRVATQPSSLNVAEAVSLIKNQHSSSDVINAFRWLMEVNGRRDVDVAVFAGLNSITVGSSSDHPKYTVASMNREIRDFYN